MRVGLFYDYEILKSADLGNALQYTNSDVASERQALLYPSIWTILSGFTCAADSPADNGISVAAGASVQNGNIVTQTGFNANILPGNYPYGSGLAADSTNPRWDTVSIAYATIPGDMQSRDFDPPAATPQNVNLVQFDGFTISVVHGVPAPSPTKPAAPSGYSVLCYVDVPANATTIVSADLDDLSLTNTNSGGRLKVSSGGTIWRNDANLSPELDTASGILLKLGTSGAQFLDNVSAGYLDISGNTASGIRILSALTLLHSFTLSGALSLLAAVSKVAGVSTSGTYGVDTVVASELETLLATTTQTTIDTFTPPQNGMYRISIYYRLTAQTTASVTVSYADAGGAQTATLVSGATQAAGPYFAELTLAAVSTSAITVAATASVANQMYVSSVIEGLS